MLDSVSELMAISSRLEHLENSAEWIARESVHSDNSISQTATMISALADDIRERVCELVHALEIDNKDFEDWGGKIQ